MHHHYAGHISATVYLFAFTSISLLHGNNFKAVLTSVTLYMTTEVKICIVGTKRYPNSNLLGLLLEFNSMASSSQLDSERNEWIFFNLNISIR